jgi:hypothetical protein
MVTLLKVFFNVLLLWMCYIVISTSINSNLFKEWNFLGAHFLYGLCRIMER